MLGATTRPFSRDQMQDYLRRVHDQETSAVEKYKMPYVHRSNITIQDTAGKTFDLDKLRADITKRPEVILKKNEKIQHSGGGSTQFYNIGLPALKGLAVNEKTGEFVIVDTCPGAGVCKTYCYAKKGGYIQWKASSMSQTKLLNYLLNDPEGFKNKLIEEITKAKAGLSKKGTDVAVRWHDAGDFFSNDYWNLAKSVALSLPDVKFYAYTKMASVAQDDKPANFIINFSSGAMSDQEKQIDFKTTKHSVVIPRELFRDIMSRDDEGKMHFTPNNLKKLKANIAAKYSIPIEKLLSYKEMMKKKETDKPTWYVIVKPGDGDDSAYRRDVIGTYLLIH
jgi:hypothetical protein